MSFSSDVLRRVDQIPQRAASVNFVSGPVGREPDFVQTSADQRRAALRDHLDKTVAAPFLFVGEAAGWRGARQSGVAFTSAPQVGLPGTREPSATQVQRVLEELSIDEQVMRWNAYPLHPHRLGDPRSNRRPSSEELDDGMEVLRILAKDRFVVCIGSVAAAALSRLTGIPTPDAVRGGVDAVKVRHPSYGGANIFRAQLLAVMRQTSP
jgi:uracil-DNA glycosylase